MRRQTDTKSACDLDVRPLVASGGDPFSLVIEAARGLAAADVLHVLLDFDPRTLCAALGSLGWGAHAERFADVVHVWVQRAAAANARPAVQAPVRLDVRGLATPRAMITILEKLVELGPGAQLLVRDEREPTLLYDKLALRGYDARAEKRGRSDYFIHVGPAWVFDDP